LFGDVKRCCVTNLHSCGSALLVLRICIVAFYLAAGCFAHGQDYYANQEVRISGLPSLTAKSIDLSDVLAASVEIILRDKAVCCGKNSALEDDVQRADPKSLKDVANRLQGRHLLSDGRPIMVTAEYLPATSPVSGLINALTAKQSLLMEWNSHMYVVYGAIYNTIYSPEGGRTDSILKIFLVDTRFSDQRREVTFDRQTDDWGKVQGLLMLKAAPQ
jgi:hypothetical protein